MKKRDGFFTKINSKIVIVAGIVLIAVFSVAASKEFIKKHQLDREISNLQNEIDRLKVEQDEFLSLIDSYNSEEFIEQEARMNFNYKKRGEKVVVIRTDKDGNSSINNNLSEKYNSQNSDQSGKTGNFKLWWNYFFGENS